MDERKSRRSIRRHASFTVLAASRFPLWGVHSTCHLQVTAFTSFRILSLCPVSAIADFRQISSEHGRCGISYLASQSTVNPKRVYRLNSTFGSRLSLRKWPGPVQG